MIPIRRQCAHLFKDCRRPSWAGLSVSVTPLCEIRVLGVSLCEDRGTRGEAEKREKEGHGSVCSVASVSTLKLKDERSIEHVGGFLALQIGVFDQRSHIQPKKSHVKL
jgi:hypothetical protein